MPPGFFRGRRTFGSPPFERTLSRDGAYSFHFLIKGFLPPSHNLPNERKVLLAILRQNSTVHAMILFKVLSVPLSKPLQPGLEREIKVSIPRFLKTPPAIPPEEGLVVFFGNIFEYGGGRLRQRGDGLRRD